MENRNYFLLKDYFSGQPMEMLIIDDKYSREEIQEYIYEVVDLFHEKEDDDGFVKGLTQEEYILEKLEEQFNCEVLRWCNDSNLYY